MLIRKLIKPSAIFGILILVSCCYILFDIKYRVKKVKQLLDENRHQITKTHEDIHLLQAELTYVTIPEKLSKLSDKYLGLVSVTGENLFFVDDVEEIVKLESKEAEDDKLD